MKLTKLLMIVGALGIAAIFSACFGTDYESVKWESANYTIEELQAMAYDTEKGVFWEGWDYDTSEESLNMYNYMLGYADNVAQVKYKIKLIFRYMSSGNTDGQEYSYSISIVLDGTDDEVSLFYNGQSHELESQIETYQMARNWYADLNTEIDEIIPGAHANYNYSPFDMSYVGTRLQSVSAANADWRQYFKHNSMYFSRINIILPPDTEESEADNLFVRLNDIMEEYRIDWVCFVCPIDDTAYNRIIEEEELYNNTYFNSDGETVKWHKAISR